MDPTNRTTAGDQYSLGCILYYCLAGHFPFPDGNPVKKMLGHQFEQPTPVSDLVPGVPAALEEVVERLMAKAPEDRYGWIDEAVEELQAIAADSRLATMSVPGSGGKRRSSQGNVLAVAPGPAQAEPPEQQEQPAPPAADSAAWVPLVGVTIGLVVGLILWLVLRA